MNKISSLFKDKFGVSDKSGGHQGRRNSDEVDTELTSIPQKPDELEGSPYGRRKQREMDSPDQSRNEELLPVKAAAPVRPPSPPVPPPADVEEEDPYPSKGATQKEISQQALSTILNSVSAKQGNGDRRDSQDSFSSAGSQDEMLPAPPLPLDPPPTKEPRDRQLMTSTLFDRFSSKITSRKAEPMAKERLSKSPTSPSYQPPTTTYSDAALSTYGLPTPQEFYQHQQVSKTYSPEIPSHPFSPGPHDGPRKPNMSSIFHGHVTPSPTPSDSPPASKTRGKGDLRSIEISSPVFQSSSNQNLHRHDYENHRYIAASKVPTSSHSGYPQMLSASSLEREVYEYENPSAPPYSPQNTAEGRGNPSPTTRSRPLTLLHETSEGMRRSLEEILTEEIGEDSSYKSSNPSRGGQQSGKRPLSTAAAVAEILANRQPLSVRISIQKHKTETSYKKSQSFGPDGQGSGNGQCNVDNSKSNGGGPKKNGGAFSESSL